MPALLKDQLKELSKQKNYKAIVDTMVNTLQAENVSEKQKRQMAEFINEELSEDKVAAEEFAVQLINAAADVYYGGIFQIGSKRDEWEEKIKKGEVPEMKLVSEEKKLVNKVANQIVLAHEKKSFVGYDLMPVIYEGFSEKKIKIKETEGKAFLEGRLLEAREKKAKEFGITQDKLADYEWDFKNQEAYKTGFEIKKEKPAEGESLFTKLPNYLQKIYDCKNSEQLDALEEEYWELEDANYVRELKAASSAKLYKKLYADFEEFSSKEENPSVKHQFTKERLENATHLGKDYILMDMDVNRDLIKPTAVLGTEVIEDATTLLQFYSDDLYKELEERIRNNEENGITGEKAEHDLDFQNNVADIYNLSKQLRDINQEFKDSKKPHQDIDEERKIRGYISKQRENRNYYSIDHTHSYGYGSTLTEQEKKLSDSLMNDLVKFEGYDRLFKLIEKNKRLYSYKMCVDSAWVLDKDEGLKKARTRYNNAYKASCEELQEQILACKEFEKTFDNPAELAGPGEDRTKLLDRMSRLLTRETNPAVNYDTVRTVWSYQNNDLDNIWIAYQYMNLTMLKHSGIDYSEEKREKYGFNISGEVYKNEEDDADEFSRNAFENCVEGNTLPELIRVIRSAGRFKIKCLVQAGKDYDDIRNALEGEENADLKAKYLFKTHAIDCSYNGLDNMNASLELTVDKMVGKGILGNDIDLSDKDLTLGELLFAIGATEEDQETYYRANGFTADKKLSEIIQDEERYSTEVRKLATELLVSIYSSQGEQYELDRLSGTDKKLFDHHESIVGAQEDPDEFKSIENWINSEGKTLGKNLNKMLLVDKVQKSTATLKNIKLAGVDPKTEIGRFYRNSMDTRNTYVAEILKDKKDPDEVIEKLVNEKKYDKLAKFSVKKMPVNYDVYIAKHTAGRGGETADEMVDNLSKVLAASALEQNGKKFSLSDIHRIAGKLKKTLVLDVMKGDEARLREALRDRKSANKIGKEIRFTVFGVKPENTSQYFTEMESLVQHMSGTKGRSSKYIALHKAIEEAAELKYKNMTPEKLRSAIITANIRIHKAVQNYVSGKEKVRRSDKGKDSFDNALDAMAIIEKHVPGFSIHSVMLINSINKVRNGNDKNAANYISHENFTKKYGADHAVEVASGQRQRQEAAERKAGKIRGQM